MTSLIIPLSIEGVDLHTTSVCTERLMICLHQIKSTAYWSLRSVFFYSCAQIRIYMYIQHYNRRSQSSPSVFRAASGGPAAAHVWLGCCGFWEPSHRGPELGLTASGRQEDVVVMSPLLGVVQKPYPQNTGDTWLKNHMLIFGVKYSFIVLWLFCISSCFVLKRL